MIGNGFFLWILSAQIVQQCIDAWMIALNYCVRPVQLQEARQNLQRRNRHGRAPLRDAVQDRTKGRYLSPDEQQTVYTFSIAAEMWWSRSVASLKNCDHWLGIVTLRWLRATLRASAQQITCV
ncbi:hypothetical protein [Bradyrhizobium lablabi]|uniref:hypothetical protein n=1 Tax=Bradyrhizobium lablabi TaxID=722472 RepID=UPI001BABECAA|nr:hypothetical protein [Bradyrhizobium lablabi]MBR0693736.1 hypothetical protein [Bradyrhizobium lablabi]